MSECCVCEKEKEALYKIPMEKEEKKEEEFSGMFDMFRSSKSKYICSDCINLINKAKQK